MTWTTGQVAAMVIVMAVVTYGTRILPFVFFPANRPIPAYVQYLGRVLSYAITGMLVVYCLRGISFLAPPHGVPEAIAVLLVILTYLWKRNSLLSIAGGTAVYMFLVQVIFV